LPLGGMRRRLQSLVMWWSLKQHKHHVGPVQVTQH
jgi:hypothetical protein